MEKSSKSYSTSRDGEDSSQGRMDSQIASVDNHQTRRHSDNPNLTQDDAKDVDETSNNTYQNNVRTTNSNKNSTKIFTKNCKNLITGGSKMSVKFPK